MEQTLSDPAGDSIHLPYQHISRKGGKSLRSKMTEAINDWFGCDHELIKTFKEICEIFQSASLLVDDVEDSSMKRRGVPCAHRIYGIPSTINSGNYYYFVALRKVILSTPKEHIIPILTTLVEGAMRMHIGQGMEIYWRDNLVCPTEEEYSKMMDLKTATFFHFIFTSCKILSGIQLDLERMIYLLGQYFQVKDDYINIKCEDYSRAKGFADDISEGKVSFPIVHAINKYPNDKTIFNILKMKTQDAELKKLVIDYLEEAGSFKYTEEVLNDLAVEIIDELEKFDHNPSFKKFVSTVFLETHRILIDNEQEEVADKHPVK